MGGHLPNGPDTGYGSMAGYEWDALAHHSMQEGGVAEETVPGSGRGEVGRLQGLQRVWAPPGYGVIF